MDERTAYRRKLEARLDQWQAEIGSCAANRTPRGTG